MPPEPIDLDANQPEDEDANQPEDEDANQRGDEVDDQEVEDYDYEPGPEEVEIFQKVLSEDEGGLHDLFQDPFQEPFEDDIICEGTQPAENTQASQARLKEPENRPRFGRRYARYQMVTESTKVSEHDSKACNLDSTEELKQKMLKSFKAIPDSEWQSTSRKNVRPSGDTTSKQKSLGLVSHPQSRWIPVPTTDTYRYRGLTQMILEYARRVTPGEKFDATSIQLTKNLKSKPHRDKNNRGPSLIFGLGDWKGGETFVQEDGGPDTYRLGETIEGIGRKNQLLHGHKYDIHQPQRFDGNQVHCTMRFTGQRYAVVLYSLGRSYEETPGLVRTFLGKLGFSLPVAEFRAPVLPEFDALAQQALEGRQVEDEPNRHRPPGFAAPAPSAVVPGDGGRKRRRVGR